MNIERYLSSVPIQRIRAKNEQHLIWVKSLPCVVSGDHGVDAHHLQLKSRGRSDLTCIPLTHALHMECHAIGQDTFETKYGVDLKDALIATLVEKSLM